MTVDHLSQQINNQFTPILLFLDPEISLFVRGYLKNHEKIHSFIDLLIYENIQQFQEILQENYEQYQEKNVVLWNIGALIKLSSLFSYESQKNQDYKQNGEYLFKTFLQSILNPLKKITKTLILCIQTPFEKEIFENYIVPYQMQFSWVERESFIMRVVNYQQRDFNSKRITKQCHLKFPETSTHTYQWLDDFVETKKTDKKNSMNQNQGFIPNLQLSNGKKQEDVKLNENRFIGGDYESTEGGDMLEPEELEQQEQQEQQEDTRHINYHNHQDHSNCDDSCSSSKKQISNLPKKKSVGFAVSLSEEEPPIPSTKSKLNIKFSDAIDFPQEKKTISRNISFSKEMSNHNEGDTLKKVQIESTFNLETSERDQQRKNAIILPHERIGHQNLQQTIQTVVKKQTMIEINNSDSEDDSDFDTDESDNEDI